MSYKTRDENETVEDYIKRKNVRKKTSDNWEGLWDLTLSTIKVSAIILLGLIALLIGGSVAVAVGTFALTVGVPLIIPCVLIYFLVQMYGDKDKEDK